jgi:tRNA threonylcarbamoyladenosine biosynthesis protein TsaE|tara:strand:- start:120 stop:596 length:477 start_codon:yes stop_codon:yes gene_type:complete
MRIISRSDKETLALGRKFSEVLQEKDVVILAGQLGGGKTTFTKGVLKGLNYKGRVLSPTFTLVRNYPTKKFGVYHVDLYRLKTKDTLNLGLEDFIYCPKTITLIEWGKKIEQELEKYILIEFSYLKENSRKLLFSSSGLSRKRAETLKKIFNNELTSN